jgi:pilus assembly protein CpaF
MVREVQDEVLGLGPLEPLLQDPTVNDILVNNYRMVFVERRGKLQRVQTRFKDDAHLRKIIDRIVTRVGRRVDEASPMGDARLEDGSRVNAIIPPLALDGPSLSIRRFSRDPLELDALIGFGALPGMGEVLRGIVRAALNIIVSVCTGSGKTTMLNCLSRLRAHGRARGDHRGRRRVATQAGSRGAPGNTARPTSGPWARSTARDLVRKCLRMRPDRIIVGEVRGAEVAGHAPGHEHRPRRAR